MDPVYYVKQKTFTVNAEPMGYRQTKNGKHQFYAKCAECGITKYRFVKKKKKKKKKKNRETKWPVFRGGRFRNHC